MATTAPQARTVLERFPAGHDPEAWNEEYEQHLARVTTKAAAS